MKFTLRYTMCLSLILFGSVINARAEEKKWDSGLIIENYKRIRISIEDISDDGKKIYLTKDVI